jgi:DNA-binding NtrC family response regulator
MATRMSDGTRPTTLAEQLAAKAGDLDAILETLLPGVCDVSVRLRGQVLEFCEDPLARTILVRGGVGVGKSTLARTVALLRYLSRLTRETQRGVLALAKFDGHMRLHKHYLQWYEELSLPGLTEDLATAQLFGVAKGGFTGATERMGLFEAAAKGHRPDGPSEAGALITGGVVLLDEIGDLRLSLQPKLLLVLTGAEVFRVGGEGNRNYGYTFDGVTVTATWQDPRAVLRQDLLSRLSDYEVTIPSLEERVGDIPIFVTTVADEIARALTEEVSRLSHVTGVDRRKLQSSARKLTIGEDDIKRLQKHPWSRSGELRGLRQVLQRVARGMAVQESLDLQQSRAAAPGSPDLDDVIDGIISLLAPLEGATGGLPELVREQYRAIKVRMAERLRENPAELQHVARKIGLDPERVRAQLSDLARVRKTERHD